MEGGILPGCEKEPSALTFTAVLDALVPSLLTNAATEINIDGRGHRDAL
jgi:hypothetical protein